MKGYNFIQYTTITSILLIALLYLFNHYWIFATVTSVFSEDVNFEFTYFDYFKANYIINSVALSTVISSFVLLFWKRETIWIITVISFTGLVLDQFRNLYSVFTAKGNDLIEFEFIIKGTVITITFVYILLLASLLSTTFRTKIK